MIEWIMENCDLLIITLGLISEFIGVYFLSKSHFLLNIWKAFFSIDNWEDAPLILRIFARFVGIKDKEALEIKLIALSKAEGGKKEFLYTYYPPFYGFIFIMLGLLLQIVGIFFRSRC